MADMFQKPLQSALTISPGRVPERRAMPAARILVIEDGSAVRRALKRLFESEGYSVDLVADGISGLELLRKTAPSAILLDLSLPDISGRESYQKIIQVAPRLPIIVITAKTDVAEKAARAVLLITAGTPTRLSKPERRHQPRCVQCEYLLTIIY